MSKSQNVQWSTEYKDNPAYIYPEKGIGFDNTGNSYLTGVASNELTYIVKFSPSGQEIWCDSLINSVGFHRINVDKDGNTFLIGGFKDSITLSPFTLLSFPYAGAAYYAKLNSNGVFQWAYKLPYRVGVYEIYPLPSGDFYGIGKTGIVGANIGSNYIDPDNNFIAKYDPSGICIKAIKIANSHTHFIFRLDVEGNFYIAGNISEGIGLGQDSNMIFVSPNSSTCPLIAKFDSSLNVLWAKVGYTYDAYNPLRGLAVDSNGNVYVAGTFIGYISFDGNMVYTDWGSNMFLVKYDTYGNYQWMKYSNSLSSFESNKCFGLTVDDAGNSYVTGGIEDDTAYFDSYVITKPYTAYLIKYDSDGNLQWGLNTELNPLDIYGSDQGEGRAICKDNSGNIFVAGNYGDYNAFSFLTKISETCTTGPFNETSTATICSGDSLIFGTLVLTDTGTYSQTFNSINGCDSIVALTLSVNPSYSDTDIVSICSGDTYVFGGQTLTTTGTYSQSFNSVNGCDSSIKLFLTVSPTYSEIIASTICSGDSFTFGTQTLTNAGTYSETFNSINGCDSIVTLILTVNPSFSDTVHVAICSGDSLIFGTQTLTASGTYSEAISAVNSCDSTAILTLTVNSSPSDPTISQSADTLFSNAEIGNQWYFNNAVISGATSPFYLPGTDGIYSILLTDSNGCSSSSLPFYYSILGVNENSEFAELKIYPSPAGGAFQIHYFSGNKEKQRLRIADMSANIIYSENFVGNYSKNIDLSRHAKGVYFVEVFSADKKRTVKKIVLE